MTEQETFELIFTINATYPKAYARFSQQEIKNLIAVWHKLLEEFNYDDCMNAQQVDRKVTVIKFL